MVQAGICFPLSQVSPQVLEASSQRDEGYPRSAGPGGKAPSRGVARSGLINS
jgi:hypothetical protein